MSHAVWADHLYLIAPSAESLQTMVYELSHSLVARGLRWKPTSFEVMYIDDEEHEPLRAHDTSGEYVFKVVDTMHALGTLVC